ncbi:MAG: hypothetical protein Kow00124_16350 [Anaerolineae bacterium]
MKNPAQRILLIGMALAVLGLTAGLTAAFWSYTQDDVYITYAYSRHIAQGEGFVFNPGERVQGSTTPLYALLMAGVSLLTTDLLHAGNLLSALLLLIACALVVDLTREALSPYARAGIAIALAASPLVYVSFGMETLLYTALLMLAFWLWARDRRTLAMLAAAALTWTRADGLVLGGTLGLLALWESWLARPASQPLPRLRDLPWELAAAYVLGIAPWFIFAWLYFGTPLPNTFSAKQEAFSGLRFWVDGWFWWRSFYGNNWLSLAGPILVLIGARAAWKHPRLRPLALWPFLYLAGYTVLNVSAFWYYTPLVAALIALAAFGAEWIARRVLAAGVGRRAVLAAGLAVVAFTAVTGAVRALEYGTPPPRVASYVAAGEWINAHTEPDATLMLGDLGIVGYHADRRTLDVPGLIVPDMYFKQEGYAVAKYRPDYVLTTRYWSWVQLVEQPWFHVYYAPVAAINTPGDEFSPMTVYRRRWPVETPAALVEGFPLPLACMVSVEKGGSIPAETRARVLGAEGEVIAEAVQPFLAGQYPAGSAPGPERLIEQIVIPLSAMPGSYRWELHCGAGPQTGAVQVLPFEQADGYIPLEGARWPGVGSLMAAALPEGTDVWSGGSLLVALAWLPEDTPAVDYSVFLHLVDAQGTIAAQLDGPPAEGRHPTTTWARGERVIDLRRIILPPDLPAGEYQLIVGVYNWQTGERVPLADGSTSLTLPVTVSSRQP